MKIFKNEINSYKKDLNIIFRLIQRKENYNKIKLKIDDLVSKIWISELTGIYQICNAILLMDIYYNIIGAKKPLKVFKYINCDLSSDILSEKLDIILPYCAWLTFLTKDSFL